MDFSIIALFASIFIILAAVCNWDWFMEDARFKLWIDLFGRKGARIFYSSLGIALLAFTIINWGNIK